MEESVVTDANFLQVLLTSPMTYIVLAIIVLALFKIKKSKSSTKCCGSNKTSTPTTPVIKKATPKKKPVAKKTASKKPVSKTTPKKTTTKRNYKSRKRTS